MDAGLLIALAAYLALMLAVGVAGYRLTHDLGDYVLGGRRLGPYVTALSAGASDMSGWLMLGLPGAVFLSGLNQSWIAVGLIAGAAANWVIVAPRLRRYTEAADDALTLPDFFVARFADRTHVLRLASAVVILVFFTIYTAAGLIAGAKLFEAIFPVAYSVALAIGAAVILAYTVAGGFLAVSWTDAIQGTLMFAALLVVPVLAVAGIGGPGAAVGKLAGEAGALLDIGHGMSFLAVLSLLAWGLGYFGQPHILARFMAIRDAREMPVAAGIGMGWMTLSLLGALAVGLSARALFGEAGLADPEQAFIQLCQTLFPPFVAGVLLAAILAAIMSTVDSQLLVSSSALAQDLYRPFLRPKAGPRELLWVGRIGVVLTAAVALFIASDSTSSVLGVVAYAWAGFGAAFGPVVLLGLTWSGMTRNGALAAMLTGAFTVIVWKNVSGGIFDVYELLPAFMLALGAGVGVSLVDAPGSDARALHKERLNS